MKHIFTIALLLIISANSHAALIDFEDQSIIGDGLLNEGDIITGMTLFGATFSVANQGTVTSGPNAGQDRQLMLFDADCNPTCTGNDPDLEIPGAGNILIISEDNDSTDPDDSVAGGKIIIDFDPAVTDLMGVTVDVGDNSNQSDGDSFAQAFFMGALIGSFDFLAGQGDNNIQTADFSGLGSIDKLEINLASSGGIVNLEFTPVPIPAALPMMFAGIAGLFAVARRKVTA